MPVRPRDDHAAQPHDRLVKFAFSRREHAVGLLKAVLSPGVAETVAWDTLRLESGSHIDPSLRSRHVDLLFSARFSGKLVYVYFLIEQQRKVDKLMVFRMGAYMWDIWRGLLKREPRDTLPPIVPILIHHSETGWTAATSFHDIVRIPERLRAELGPHVPSFKMAVVDVSPGQATRIVERMLTGFGRMVLFCLSAAGNDDRLKQGIQRMTEALDATLTGLDGVDALHALLRYLLATHQEMTPTDIVDLLEATGSGKQRKVIMDELDVFRVEGRVEGRQEGAAKVLLLQLKARFGAVPADARARILAAKEATLARWSLRVLTAPTLDAVLGGKAKKAAPARRPAPRRRPRAA